MSHTSTPVVNLRSMAVVLAVVGIMLLAVVVALSGGEGTQPDQPSVGLAVPAPQEDSSASETPTDSATDDDGEAVDELLPLVTYEVFLARDPFEPVVPVTGGGTDGGTTGGTDGGTTGGTDGGTTGDTDGGTTGGTDGGTTGGTDGGTTGGTDGGTTGGTDGSAPTGTCVKDSPDQADCRHTVTLVDVFVDEDGTERAVIQVDDQLFEVSQGQEFATHFMVRSIEPPCVTLVYGDDGFTLCEGEQVLK